MSAARVAMAWLTLATGICCHSNKNSPELTAASVTLEPAADPALVARGHALLQTFECARCHDSDAFEPAPRDRHCVHCHQSILAGDFPVAPEVLREWQGHIEHLTEVPALRGMQRLRRSFVAAYLQAPTDMRPKLATTMPRLRLDHEQAAAIAAALVPDAEDAPPGPTGAAERGRELVSTRGCMTCHMFTGVAALPILPPPQPVAPEILTRAIAQAPDLRFTRDRMRPAGLHAWLDNPERVKPGTLMPTITLRGDQIRDIAAFLLTTQLDPPAAVAVPTRLPVLDRPVRFAEVNAKIFHRTCWHCHSDPEYARGDGGPGNTGGLGFAGRGLDLSNYAAIANGSRGPDGVPRSIFAPLADGTPRIIAHLLARHAEVAGQVEPELRGMPLGLTPVALEDIQLLDTWIAQGRPQ